MDPDAPITVRPVVICSMGYTSSYVVISNEADAVEVEGFYRYFNLKATRPAMGTESMTAG
jgi:hypothetical protein